MSHFHFSDTCHVSLSHNAAASERVRSEAARHQLERSNRMEGGGEEEEGEDGSGLNSPC